MAKGEKSRVTQLPPRKAEPQQSAAKGNSLLTAGLFLGVCAVGGTGAWFFNSSQESDIDLYSGTDPLMDPTTEPRGAQSWNNPQLSTYEKIFCRGNRNSANCEPRPLHPFNDYFEPHGITANVAEGRVFQSKKDNSKLAPDQFELDSKALNPRVDLE